MLDGFSRYVFRQLLLALVFVTLGLAALIWLTQSLRYLELIVNRGLSLAVFFQLTLMMLPNFIAVILPVTLFIVVLFTYNRLSSDRELVAMRATGVGPWGLGRPALALALAATLLGYALNLWLVPDSYRAFRQYQFEIRNQVAAVLLQEGVFNPVGDAITVYVRRRERDGALQGLLIHDARDRANPITIMAERGQLLMGAGSPRVVLFNGSRQEVDRATGRLRLLTFEENLIDLAQTRAVEEVRYRDARERGVLELLSPPAGENISPRDRARFYAEAHQRLAQPLGCIVLALIALAALLRGDFSRHGQLKRILGAIGIVVLLQSAGLGAGSLVARDPGLAPLIWLHAILPGLAAAWYLGAAPRRRTPPADPASPAASAAPALAPASG
ncbi:MAG: LPS export ABC transporter permease LptF [Alphaproteobacteria bacterium]|nr:LPS export ABC transporter permease LptF [Alphaproteobacteria bacterium]